jgi:hypothetical protein
MVTYCVSHADVIAAPVALSAVAIVKVVSNASRLAVASG